MLSFLSEHSCEYIIVPQLCEILKNDTRNIIPLYFWASREGSSISLNIHKDLSVNVIAVFPRRPRLSATVDDYVYGKFHEYLFEFSGCAKDMGIATIAGIPLVTSLNELSSFVKCIWFNIKAGDASDVYFRINKNDNRIFYESKDSHLFEVLQCERLKEIYNNTKTLSWEVAINNMKMLRYLSRIDSSIRFWRLYNYKPVYILSIRK